MLSSYGSKDKAALGKSQCVDCCCRIILRNGWEQRRINWGLKTPYVGDLELKMSMTAGGGETDVDVG